MSAKRRLIIVAVIVFLSFSSFSYFEDALTYEERAALIVLIAAGSLWTTEAIPLAATSILIPLLQSVLGVQGFREALAPFFDPVNMLLLGGFLLAVAVEKYDVDEYFAYLIISRVRASARLVVFVIMLTTAFLSMWISNTASTALLIAMAMKIIDEMGDEKGNFSKILVLSIAYSSTAGGLSTLVGTTTCAMAAASLKEIIGYEITFLGWMFYGLPVSILMVLIIWIVLFAIFPTDVKEIRVDVIERMTLTRRQRHVIIIFVASILAWLTGKIPEPIAVVIGWHGHGYDSSVVAAMIAVALYFTGILDEQDLRRANWSTILLIGGGLSLGKALEVSGLVTEIGNLLISFTGEGSLILSVALVVAFGLGISIVASNTASAGIFLPISIGMGNTTGVNPVIMGVAVGISTSLDFMLPVGTPPNAIAYSTGKVTMSEMIKAGFMLDIIGAALTVALAWLLWPLLV